MKGYYWVCAGSWVDGDPVHVAYIDDDGVWFTGNDYPVPLVSYEVIGGEIEPPVHHADKK